MKTATLRRSSETIPGRPSLNRVTAHAPDANPDLMPRPSSLSPDAPTVRLPAPGGEPTVETTETTTKPADLSVSKVLAAGGAAATSAVLGSYLGAAGTVSGAAVGAVASTVAAVVYQRSIERTRITVLSRIRPVPVPSPRPAPPEESDRTVLLRPEPPRRPKRRVRAVLLGVLAFVLALGAITGIEWARGETLTTGETGTSVGRVVAPPPAAEEEPADPVPAEESTEEDATPTSDAEATEEPSAPPEPGRADEESAPGSGDGTDADTDGNNDAGPTGGAEPTGTPQG